MYWMNLGIFLHKRVVLSNFILIILKKRGIDTKINDFIDSHFPELVPFYLKSILM